MTSHPIAAQRAKLTVTAPRIDAAIGQRFCADRAVGAASTVMPALELAVCGWETMYANVMPACSIHKRLNWRS